MPLPDDDSEASIDQLDTFQRETPFESQENDEQMWEVIEIIAEKHKFYKVRWAGFDPATKRPWAPSWVAKHDCTDDLVLEWKRKETKRKMRANKRSSKNSKHPRTSMVSHITEASRGSKTSTVTKHSTRSKSPSTASGHANKPKQHNHGAPTDTSSPPNQIIDQLRVLAPPKKRKLPASFEVRPQDKRRKNNLLGVEEHKGEQEPWNIAAVSRKHERLHKGNGILYPEDEEQSESGQLEYVTPHSDMHELNSSSNADDNHTAHETSSASTPKHKAGYLKHRSGKLSTPKKRLPSGSVQASSTSSDEVEIVVPRQLEQDLAYDPKEYPPLLSPSALELLREFDDWMQSHSSQNSRMRQATLDSDNGEGIGYAANVVNDEGHVDPEAVPKVVQTRRWSEDYSHPPVTTNGAKDDSYRRGIVPETQSSQSTSQLSRLRRQKSQEFPHQIFSPPASPMGHDIDIESEAGFETHPQKSPILQSQNDGQDEVQAGLSRTKRPRMPSTPSRSSLIARMKPRTPRSGSQFSVIDDPEGVFNLPEPRLEAHLEVDEEHEDEIETTRSNSRPLQRLPLLSPSTFKPHLPKKGLTISGAELGRRFDLDETEIDVLLSSIEQFSSPEKGGKKRRKRDLVQRKGKEKETAIEHPDLIVQSGVSIVDDDSDSGSAFENVVRQRGEQLAQRARTDRGRLERERLGTARNRQRKKPLGQVLTTAQNRTSSRDRRKEQSSMEPERQLKRGSMESQGQGSLVDDWQQQESELVVLRQEEEESTQDLLTELRQQQQSEVMALRQEEEESTQDLMKDAALTKTRHWDQRESSRKAGPQVEEAPKEHAHWGSLQDNQQQRETEIASMHHEEESVQNLLTDVISTRPLEDTSRRDVEPIAQIVGDTKPTPAESPEHRSEGLRVQSRRGSCSSSKMTVHQQLLDSDLVLPPTAPTPSLPDAHLEAPTGPPDFVATLALLNEKSQENAQLIKEIDSLREALASGTGVPKMRDSEQFQALSEMQASRDDALTSLADSERRVADLTRGKQSAEKDVEFFREQYAKASGFVTSVREENVELEKQTQIARGQAETGVKMVKASFEARVKTLEDDAKSWKRLAMFIMEKDVRTNDGIRRKAAEEPELRARCKKLQDYAELQEEQLEELKQERERQDEDMARLRSELKETQARLEQAVEGASMTGKEMVYRCQWRLEGSGGVCDGLFSSIEELQEHMYTGGHLYA